MIFPLGLVLVEAKFQVLKPMMQPLAWELPVLFSFNNVAVSPSPRVFCSRFWQWNVLVNVESYETADRTRKTRFVWPCRNDFVTTYGQRGPSGWRRCFWSSWWHWCARESRWKACSCFRCKNNSSNTIFVSTKFLFTRKSLWWHAQTHSNNLVTINVHTVQFSIFYCMLGGS